MLGILLGATLGAFIVICLIPFWLYRIVGGKASIFNFYAGKAD